MNDEELDSLVVDVRRQWGERFPVPSRDESAVERDLREQITRDVIEREVLPELARQRVLARLAPLTSDEDTALAELIVSENVRAPSLADGVA